MAEKSRKKEENKQYAITPLFHQRFNIEFGAEEAQQRFMNRVLNKIPVYIKAVAKAEDPSILWQLADKLGVYFTGGDDYEDYLGNDFYSYLDTLEKTHEVLPNELKQVFSEAIAHLISESEVDLGIQWREGVFWPSGAKLLDEEVVDKTLHWLSTPKYHDVSTAFREGLRHFMKAVKYPEELRDSVRDMYEALEKMARIATANNKNLLDNIDEFVGMLGLDTHYSKMLKEHTGYAHKFRHAVKEGRKRMPPSRHEVEAFIYTTGLLIRLAIQQLEQSTKITWASG